MMTKPLVRWWWLSGPFDPADISRQLRWMKAQGFGGIEIAWIDPTWLDRSVQNAPRPAFLSPEWTDLVTWAKRETVALGLRCDFTFGSSWPFGGSWLPQEHAAKTFTGDSPQRLGGSWEAVHKERRYIVDHLSAEALMAYSRPLLAALKPALPGGDSALFCDSLEIATEGLWSPRLWNRFADRFVYRLESFAASIDRNPGVRYDYRKFRGEVIRDEFYGAFTAICHAHNVQSRVQCHGAPADPLAAYAAVDVPESEALLFAPEFSRIAASAAAWAGKPVVSAEAFTCLHGFPGWDESAEELWKRETASDLKLLADALFANGVNQIVWHGMPYQPAGQNPEFYAAVHVGADSSFIDELPALNRYFEQVCQTMREGEPFASVGVYLPWEDALMQNRIPAGERTPGANYRWEMRHARQPEELAGYAPVWISAAFLQEAWVDGESIRSRALSLQALYIDCKWLDAESLEHLLRLAQAGARIVCRGLPRQPGHLKLKSYRQDLKQLIAAGCDLALLEPLVSGEDLPVYSARQAEGELILFFAHPLAKQITYPMQHRLSDRAEAIEKQITVHWNGRVEPLQLRFGPNQPVIVRIQA